MLFEWWTVVVAAIAAGVLMPVAIRARTLGYDGIDSVQNLHATPTSRLGGAVVFGSVLAVAGIAVMRDGTALSMALLLVLAALPVVAVVALQIRQARTHPQLGWFL